MTSITVTDLVLERPDFRLGPITLEFPAGTRTALVGPSGAGKSTFLRCIAGLDTPTSGDVRFGEASMTHGARGAVPPDQRGIGFAFQRGALWPHMTALEHLRFVAPELAPDAARGLLGRVGLDGLADRKPATLSGGEAQRLSLARALASRPAALLLDEPLASVDAHLKNDLSLLVRTLAEQENLTLIVVTHDRDEALAMADRIAVLRAGRLAEHGEALELLGRPKTATTAAFLGRATCFAAETGSNGFLSTPFGEVERPTGGVGPWSLVVLPGDLVPTDGPGTPARVLRSEPALEGFRVQAVVDGRAVELATSEPLAPGTDVTVAFRGNPRVLPESSASER